jgi:hypothetical protein
MNWVRLNKIFYIISITSGFHVYQSAYTHSLLRCQEEYWEFRRSHLCISGWNKISFCTARLRLKRDGTRTETRFSLSRKRTSPFKSAWALVQSTAGNRVVRISVSDAGYTTFRGSVKSTGYPLHSPVSPSLPLPCVTVCHLFSNALYFHRRT